MLNISRHRIELAQILLSIYKDSLLAGALGFKGGTAAYLFYHLPRFSTDLDFDLLSKREGLDERLTNLLGTRYQVRDHSVKRNTWFWLISYEKEAVQIKIEISTRKFPNTYESRNFYGATIRVITIGDMIAHKLVSVQDRKKPANRDIFDAHYFLSSPWATRINFDLIELRTGLNPKEFYRLLLAHLEKVSNKTILEGMGEVLSQSQKDWAKTLLLTELKELVRLQIDSFPSK